MNWFERYGIVGMFFIIMTAIWFLCLFPEGREFLKNKNNAVLLKNIGWFCGLAFLPCGYIIMIWSQLFYYFRRRIHFRYWNDLQATRTRDEILNAEREGELPRFNQNSEAEIEAILTYYDRTKIKDLKTNKFLSEFATKRYDVVAINAGLIWALVFSFLATLCIETIILSVSIKWGNFSTWLVIIVALLIIGILFHSGQILESQIFEVGRRQLRNISLTTSSSRPEPPPNGVGSGG